MNNGLKIYVCSGVGSVDINSYKYWTAGTKDYENSPAINSLLSQINAANVDATYLDLTQEEKIDCYNKIDFLTVCLVLAQSKLANEQKASVLQKMYDDGAFDFASFNDSQREEHLNSLIEQALSDDKMYAKSGDIYKWFTTDIAQHNDVLFSPEQQKKIAAAINSISGVGATDFGSLTEYIEQAGQYFLYRFIPENKRSGLSGTIKNRIKKQDEFYQYVLNNFVPAYGTQADLDRLIRTNIISNYKTTPEKAVEALLKGEGVGVVTEATILAAKLAAEIIGIVLSALATLATIAATIIYACKEVIAAKATAKYAVPENIESGCPAASDWPGAEEYAKNNSGNSWIKYGLIGALLLLILKK